ncbi:MAG TPA: aldehyde ferredoxin oxidoreductase family protein [Chloroflexia bacterium]|nr:aldehyde ferredoxin oxidoreductase family protein [Chloroflexia bacterium]
MTDRLPGYQGCILRYDLTTGVAERWAPPAALYRAWLGGSALAARLAWDLLGPDLARIAPFDPANPVLVMAGPLTDSRLPGLPRFTVSARSPQTNLWAESNCGGYFGAELKFAGYDGLIVTGAAAAPAVLVIADDAVTLLPADDVWGQDAYTATDRLAGRHALPMPGGRRRLAQVMTIGPAGEHRVRYAALINHKAHLSARTGLGAVLGSKQLKALVVVGSGGPAPPADPALLRAVRWRMLERIKGSLVLGALHEYGTSGALELGMYEGDVPVGNWRESPDWHEAAARLGGAALADSILAGRHTCYACPIACKRVVAVPDGPYQTAKGAGPESETVAAFGTLLGNSNLAAVARANDLCNRLGMDTISCGATIAFAVECYEQGVLTAADTGGLALRWGDVDTVLALLPAIATRQGFGDWLADGSAALAERLGPAATPFLSTVKRLEAPMHDPRAFHGLGLAYATAPGGASHTADITYPVESGSQQLAIRGLEGRGLPREDQDRGLLVMQAQNLNQVYGMALAFCQLAGRAFAADDILDAYAAVTGVRWTVDDLMAAGDRIWNLKRGLAYLCGARQADDTLPSRLRKRATARPGEGPPLDLDALLADFYRLRELDSLGRPSRARLEAAGLADLAAVLYDSSYGLPAAAGQKPAV